uniref:39S ribosomal protein L33, mitochondrial n=9 Tax=Neoaves TaxID=3078114 RepID=A0A8D2PJJ9_ZOSLA
MLIFLFFFFSSPVFIPPTSLYILVRMKSAAETGYCFNIRRLRLQEKLVLLRYDPIGKLGEEVSLLFVEYKKFIKQL